MKKFFIQLSSLLVIFFIINFFLSIILEPINKFIRIKILNKPVYNEESLRAIGIDRKEEGIFYDETWNRTFRYVQFAEHYESETYDQIYVNVTKNDGRKVINKKNCSKNFYFYGSSLTFGYNVKDEQTIPSYFKDILNTNYSKSNYCVYNFGSASYFSTQENILFQTHILDNRINENDFIFFINGRSENGNKNSRVSADLESLFNGLNARMLDEIKFSFLFFWDSLPTTKLYYNLKKIFIKVNLPIENNSKSLINEISKKEIKDVFQKNILIREAICNNLKFNCFTFLQPFPNIHVFYDKKVKQKNIINKLDLERYDLLKNTKYIFDISNSLVNNTSPALVDPDHYSPKSNKLIANSIYDIVKERIEKNF